MRQSLFLLGLPLALALPQPDTLEARKAVNKERAQGVKDCFQFAWDGYYKYAFPNDELHPVSNGFGNTR
jgi:mannosyl-oligosaccharide alpha-1,2-mannosidase